jgi:hypothetical protein
MSSVIGWTRDSKWVLLHDNWDVWQIPVTSGTPVNLTVNGRKDAIRYQRRFPIEPPEDRDEGIDLSKPLTSRRTANGRRNPVSPASTRESPASRC